MLKLMLERLVDESYPKNQLVAARLKVQLIAEGVGGHSVKQILPDGTVRFEASGGVVLTCPASVVERMEGRWRGACVGVAVRNSLQGACGDAIAMVEVGLRKCGGGGRVIEASATCTNAFGGEVWPESEVDAGVAQSWGAGG